MDFAGIAGGAAGDDAAGLVEKMAWGLMSSLNGIQKAFPVANLTKTSLDSIY